MIASLYILEYLPWLRYMYMTSVHIERAIVTGEHICGSHGDCKVVMVIYVHIHVAMVTGAEALTSLV